MHFYSFTNLLKLISYTKNIVSCRLIINELEKALHLYSFITKIDKKSFRLSLYTHTDLCEHTEEKLLKHNAYRSTWVTLII